VHIDCIYHNMSSPTDSISKQKEYLLLTIKEAKLAEAKRIQRLETDKSKSSRIELEKRFELERANDREKILRLSEDCNRLQEAVSSGKVDLMDRQFQNPSKLNMSANRFVGLECESDIIFHKMVCEKFQKANDNFQRASAPKVNLPQEVKKVSIYFVCAL
jgi:hypothetical protein